MSDRNKVLAHRIREVLLEGRWIANTNFKDQLLQVKWQDAAQRVSDCNSIAALTFHINYYLAGVHQALETGKLEIRDALSFNHNAVQSEEDWKNLVEIFLRNSEKFADKVAQIDDKAFDEPFIDGKYGTLLRNIEAVIEHSYYHLGQISLLRKMISTSRK